MANVLEKQVQKVFGNEYKIENIKPLLGGAQKHTMLASCTNGFQCVIYEWNEKNIYFDNDNKKAIFCSSSAKLFRENNKLMTEHNVRTPKLYYIDDSRAKVDYDYAFVEYIDGFDLDHIMVKEPERFIKCVKRLNDNIERLHEIKSERVGQVGRMQEPGFDILEYTIKGMKENCEYLKEHDKEYQTYYDNAFERAKKLIAYMDKRSKYTFVHGELGPNHVMVDVNDQPYLIDIEGGRFVDVEEEESFLNLRFDRQLKREKKVDSRRMEFYHLMHCFSNLRGALELKQKGYYDMDDVNGMIDFFHGEFEK